MGLTGFRLHHIYVGQIQIRPGLFISPCERGLRGTTRISLKGTTRIQLKGRLGVSIVLKNTIGSTARAESPPLLYLTMNHIIFC